MPLLPNVLLSIARSIASATGNTPSAQPLYAGIVAHIMPNIQSGYKNLPVAAVQSDYETTADSGTDIVEGDIVTSITLIEDGITPWPGLGAVNNNEYFRVTFTRESTPGPLAHRKVYIARIRGGGVVNY